MIINAQKPVFIAILTFFSIVLFKEESTQFLAGYLFAFIVMAVTAIFSTVEKHDIRP